jgi:hypothetical protein
MLTWNQQEVVEKIDRVVRAWIRCGSRALESMLDEFTF